MSSEEITQIKAKPLNLNTVGELLHKKVTFYNKKTKRHKKGKIRKLTANAALIVDKKYKTIWVPWHHIYID